MFGIVSDMIRFYAVVFAVMAVLTGITLIWQAFGQADPRLMVAVGGLGAVIAAGRISEARVDSARAAR
ncbi:hypothetical protein [Agromyces humi]|uniref:hypothetical protein n=1 Tax=Agromyces humi TaxID=1766800 RepID=UPI001357D0E5|nr:hypothetical protein [Agromyces humi]